jgi:hypothetical protein
MGVPTRFHFRSKRFIGYIDDVATYDHGPWSDEINVLVCSKNAHTQGESCVPNTTATCKGDFTNDYGGTISFATEPTCSLNYGGNVAQCSCSYSGSAVQITGCNIFGGGSSGNFSEDCTQLVISGLTFRKP